MQSYTTRLFCYQTFANPFDIKPVTSLLPKLSKYWKSPAR